MTAFLLILAIGFYQDIPLKPFDEFEIKLDYDFRPRPVGDYNTVAVGELGRGYGRRTTQSVLPYLVLHIKPLKLQGEKMRVRISTLRDERVLQKKVEPNSDLVLDMGFTDDMKDRVTPHHYTVTFLDADKNPVDRIVINIGEDGSFFVNGEMRGKF